MGYLDDDFNIALNKASNDLYYLDDFYGNKDNYMSHPPIKDLNIPPAWKIRIIRLLKKGNIFYIKELITRSASDLLEIPGMKEEYLDAIEVSLNEIGLSLSI